VVFLVGGHQGLERTHRLSLCTHLHHLDQLYEVGTLYMVHIHMLQSRHDLIQDASVNRANLQPCFIWFGNIGADAAIVILKLKKI
jgi:hypothetical protein